MWFRCDLRISDNPALFAALKQGQAVLPIYIFDNANAGIYAPGAASRVWLHHALSDLSDSLFNQLVLYKGDPQHIIPQIVARHAISHVYWNRCYEPWAIKRDTQIKTTLQTNGITVRTFNALLLWEPWTVLKQDKTPYRVFTPFYRKGCLQAVAPRLPLPVPKPASIQAHVTAHGETPADVDAFALLPTLPWYRKLCSHWHMNEQGAQNKLAMFLETGLCNYKIGRNFPSQNAISRLSPYLHHGQISPHSVWHAAQNHLDKAYADNTGAKDCEKDVDCFCSELGWREFSYYLLYHFPTLPQENLQQKFDAFPWLRANHTLYAWQKGQTGVPIVDAGMRELWQTGYMHNRLRMIVGSFLVKNLLLHWQYGERWFWDCLLDADLASNSASWQWIAGSGADAAPYFRIFNPVMQGEKFDPQGTYTRYFVPELQNVPNTYLFCPWQAPPNVLAQAGVVLGDTYPYPVVDLKESRARALAAFQTLS